MVIIISDIKYLILILLLLGISSCKKAQEVPTTCIVADVAKDYPPKEIYLQDIAEIIYIPMGTTNSTLVNSNPSSVSPEGIVTRGTKVGEILLFDQQGQKLQGGICRRGQGPEEMINRP